MIYGSEKGVSFMSFGILNAVEQKHPVVRFYKESSSDQFVSGGINTIYTGTFISDGIVHDSCQLHVVDG